MDYKIMASDGDEAYYFYGDDYDKAMLLYSMAIHSKMFAYVQISKLREEYIPMEDWSEE